MKILLVSPACPNTFWGLKHALEFVSKKAVLPPLGLLTIAAMLPKSWELKLVDMTITPLTDDDIRWADYVFIGAMYIHKRSVLQVIDRCKKAGKPMVAGGPLFTAVSEEYDDIDHLVLNEAEITLPLFLKDLANGSARHIYKTDQWADVKDTPIPLWNLLNPKPYMLMCVQYSRGCPFNCDFCNVTTLFGHRMRTKNAEQVLNELESLYNFGWQGDVFFVDDNFIGNTRHLKQEILPAIIAWMEKRKYPFRFNTQASINLADDDELMQMMVRAGFNCVFVGIETPSQEGLIECNKVQNRGRDLIESVKKIHASGMQVQGGFIVGFDSDNPSIFKNLVQFIQDSGIVTAMVGLLNAPTGTKLHARLEKENRLLPNVTGDNTDLTMNFCPVMDHKELLTGYLKVVKTIYSDKNYYSRIATFLKTYRPPNYGRFRVEFDDIKALIRSIWHIGIKGKNRRHYWKLILWGFTRPQYLDLVVTFVICGYHYQKTFNELPSVT